MTFTAGSSHFLCREKESGRNRLFSVGNNDFGQLGNGSSLASHVPVDISEKFSDEVIQIASGGYHTLAITNNNKVYGFGKRTKGQFASRF